MRMTLDQPDDQESIIFFNTLIGVMQQILIEGGNIDVAIIEEINLCKPTLEMSFLQITNELVVDLFLFLQERVELID